MRRLLHDQCTCNNRLIYCPWQTRALEPDCIPGAWKNFTGAWSSSSGAWSSYSGAWSISHGAWSSSSGQGLQGTCRAPVALVGLRTQFIGLCTLLYPGFRTTFPLESGVSLQPRQQGNLLGNEKCPGRKYDLANTKTFNIHPQKTQFLGVSAWKWSLYNGLSDCKQKDEFKMWMGPLLSFKFKY